MLSKTFTAAALALIASKLVSAQTFTDCDPTKEKCRPDPAFGSRKAECNFLNGKCDVFQNLPGTEIDFDERGAVFSIEKESNAPTVETPRYMFFGRLDVECQAALGNGIVTSIVLESDNLDEIDLEWVGGDDTTVQTNYFSKGDTTTYDRGGTHKVSQPLTTFHTYSIEWTAKAIVWYINGNPVRTLTYEDAKGGSTFPQTPMQVKLGTWVAGRKDAPKGTIEWVGGVADFSEAPFNAYYKSVKIVDYAGGDKPATGDIKEYVYTGSTGSWESIKVIKGDGSSDDGEKETTTTKAATKTKTVEATKTKTVESESETETETETETESETKTKTKSAATTTLATTLTTAVATDDSTTATEDSATTTAAETSGTASVVPDSAAGAKSVSMVGLVVAGVVAAAMF